MNVDKLTTLQAQAQRLAHGIEAAIIEHQQRAMETDATAYVQTLQAALKHFADPMNWSGSDNKPIWDGWHLYKDARICDENRETYTQQPWLLAFDALATKPQLTPAEQALTAYRQASYRLAQSRFALEVANTYGEMSDERCIAQAAHNKVFSEAKDAWEAYHDEIRKEITAELKAMYDDDPTGENEHA